MVREVIPPPERRRVSMINFGNKQDKQEEENRQKSGINFNTNHDDDLNGRRHDEKAINQYNMPTAMDQHDALKRSMNGPSKPFDSNAKATTKPFQSVAKPTGIFHTEADTKAEAIVTEVLKKYPNYEPEKNRIKNMAKQLIANDLMTISTWGEPFLVEQKNLVNEASKRIQEFSALKGSDLLNEVLEFSKHENSGGGFFQRLTSKFATSEAYDLRVAALKQHLSGILPTIVNYNNSCKNSLLVLYVTVLSVVDDNTQGKDKIIEEAFYNRRMLLNGALKNLEMLNIQLNQTMELISNMLNEISHIMDVVLPALKMKSRS
jgi:hypothetical protein